MLPPALAVQTVVRARAVLRWNAPCDQRGGRRDDAERALAQVFATLDRVVVAVAAASTV